MLYQKYIVKITLFIAIAMAITACANGPVDPEHSTIYSIPAGSSLVLNREITIPAEYLSVFIQNGYVKNFRDIDKYYPYCKFEVRTRQGRDTVIRPDTFIIHRYTTDEIIVQGHSSPFRRIAEDGGGGPSFIEMFRVMYLHSELQPDVLRVACGHRAVSPNYDHLTIAEVRKTLGDLMSLNLIQKQH